MNFQKSKISLELKVGLSRRATQPVLLKLMHNIRTFTKYCFNVRQRQQTKNRIRETSLNTGYVNYSMYIQTFPTFTHKS